MDKLLKQIEFLTEIDKVKNVFRQSLLSDASRHENDAEHSWHLCMYAIVLEEYAEPGTDMLKVLKMALVHDLVEIYAGDTYLYDEAGNLSKARREKEATSSIQCWASRVRTSELSGRSLTSVQARRQGLPIVLTVCSPLCLTILPRAKCGLKTKYTKRTSSRAITGC